MSLTALTVAAVIIGLLLCYAYALPDTPKPTYVKKEPKPGEVWAFAPLNQGPWPPKDGHSVKVLDVQGGWVRYYMNATFDDNRARLETFCDMYTLAP